MAVYFTMLFVTSAFALMSNFCPTQKSIMLQKQGLILSFSPKKLMFFLSFLPLFLVSALRYQVGVDYNSYSWIFEAITQTYERTHVEAGYTLFNQIVGFFTTDYIWLFMVTSVFIILFFAVAIYTLSPNRALSIFLFITLGYYFYSMISIRHFMALSIFFFALRYMEKPSKVSFVKFLALILLAACFHKIALIAIPIYFVFTQKFTMRYYVIFAVILVVCAVFNKQLMNIIFSFIYEAYKGSVYNVYDFSIYNVLLSAIAVFFGLAYYDPLLKKSKGNIIYINAAIFMLLFYLTCWWIPTPTRIGHFGTIMFILLIPKALACEQNQKIKRLYTVLVIIFGLLFMWVMLLGAKSPSLALLPYKTIFDR